MKHNIHSLAAKFLVEMLVEKLAQILLGEKVPLDMSRVSNGDILIPANRKINKTLLREVAACMLMDDFEIDPSPVRNVMQKYFEQFKVEYTRAAVGYLASALVAIEENKKLNKYLTYQISGMKIRCSGESNSLKLKSLEGDSHAFNYLI